MDECKHFFALNLCRLNGEGLREDDVIGPDGGLEYERLKRDLARQVWGVVYWYSGTGGREEKWGDGGVVLEEVHGAVMDILHGGGGGGAREREEGEREEREREEGKGGDVGLKRLAESVGMPAGGDYSRLGLIHHVVSVIQCMVMEVSSSSSASSSMSPLSLGLWQDESGGLEDDGQRQNAHGGNGAMEGKTRDWKASTEVLRKIVGACGEKQHMSAKESLYSVLECVNKWRVELPSGYFDPVIPGQDAMNDRQQALMEMVLDKVGREAQMRRRMMVDRAMLTLKSFATSPRVKEGNLMGVMDGLVEEARRAMDRKVPCIDMASIYGTTKGELIGLMLENTRNSDSRGSGGGVGGKRSLVKTIQIGDVPDRGGRPEGQSRRAALMMPEWAPRKLSDSDGGGNRRNKKGRGRGGGGSGGRGGGGGKRNGGKQNKASG